MEICPKCKRVVELEDLIRHVSTYNTRTHICSSCAIKEGQPTKVEPYRESYDRNGRVLFQKKRRR